MRGAWSVEWQTIRMRLRARRYDLLVTAVVIGLGLAIYLPALQGGFVYDDHFLVERNYAIRSLAPGNVVHIFTQPVNDTYRPMRVFSYALDFGVWGLRPFGYHVTNVLLHVLNGVLVYWLLLFLLGSRWSAAVGGLLFTALPIQSEAVAWISGRKDVLATAFVLGAFLLYLHTRSEFTPVGGSRRPTRPREAAGMMVSWLLFIGALLTKEHAAALVGVLFVYELLTRSGQERNRVLNSVIAILPYLGIGIMFVAIYFWIGHGHGLAFSYHGGGWLSTFALMVKGFAYYLGLIFFPVRLCADYDTFGGGGFDGLFALSGMTLALVGLGMALVVFRILRRPEAREESHAILVFGLAWFFVMLAPVSNVVPIAARIAERYLYMPSVGFCLFAAVLAGTAVTQRARASFGRKPLLLLCGLILFFGVLARQRAGIWTDAKRLWGDSLRTYPDSPRVNYSLGRIYHKRLAGAGFQAEFHYRKALQANPQYAWALVGLAHVELDRGRLREAIEDLDRAVALRPSDALIHADYASVLSRLRRWDAAMAEYLAAARLSPNDPDILRDLGRVCLASGRVEQAFAVFHRVIAMCPAMPAIFSDLGNACLALGRYREAADALKKALAESPGDTRIAFNLSYAYEKLGQMEKAKGEK